MAPFTTLASLLTLALVAGVQAQSASASAAQSSAPALGSSSVPAQSSAVASVTSAAASAAQPSASAGAGPDTSCDAHGCFKQIELSDGTPLELTQSVKYNTSGVNFTLACAYVHEGSSGPSAIKLFDPAQLEAAGAAALAGFARDEKAIFAREDSAYIARDFPVLSRKAQGTGYACYYNDTHDLVAHDKEGTTEEDACPEVMLC
ncbi:uncharacterized protein SCHCODRAFT_02646103 [Schizophyllum commune H4-8]|uniref:Expressed protein n=1 Tax=Schizophyllum commune (strain H4-8 / FGSC 9210) TaxID=578458 RepID=D8Q6R6_SCHCM|nr:uncharacterized protein SCHCODRAFT_02630105 [Schizophyllum commune H4-8]XP_050196859.1 uncharacterized protein SCHCODRAFT_02646103 [Schizophyllum commune H4-8]KAI5836581.1 hypothetical protein SCHCODRAFT_02646103 [Schizophyllum commune H4-8]KAI5891816.1 hypothetical protein SCHCODRAFT_02630105 [Schizophyllum commune H4-8]